MLVLGITDIHGGGVALPDIPGLDLVLIAGDITHFGDRKEAELVLNRLGLPDVPVLAVPGNCDGGGVSSFLEEMDLSIDGKIKELYGLPFYGVGGALAGPASTPRELAEEDFKRNFNVLEDSKDLSGGVLVCHQPPHGTKLDKALGFRHVGSRSVRAFIEKHSPALCLTGHIHESNGIDRLGQTVIVNPGPFRHGHFVLCRLENNSVSCTLERV